MKAGQPRLLLGLPILLVLLTLPAIVVGVFAVRNDTTDMLQWLPDSRHEKEQYDRLVQHFGPDDTLLISWPGCTFDDPRLSRFATSLDDYAGARTPRDRSRLFRDISTGTSLLERLVSDPISLSRERALKRLQGVLVGPDRHTTGVLIKVTPEGKRNPHAVIKAITSVAHERCDLNRDQLRIGGGIYEVVIIDNVSAQSLRDCIGVSCLVGFIAALVCLRSVRQTLVVLIAGVYCGALSVAIVYYAGDRLNAVMIVLPTLVFVLTISGSVHLVNYYRDAFRASGATGAGWQALAVGCLPCTLASATTALGMMSLSISQIRPVRTFGFYSAATLLAALFVMLAFVPLTLQLWPDRFAADRPRLTSTSHRVTLAGCVVHFIVRRHLAVMASCVLLFLALGTGLLKTTSSVNLQRMFRSDNELIRNYQWLETHVAPLAALEVVIHCDSGSESTMLDRIRLIRRVEQRLGTLPEIGATFSAATLSPATPTSGGMRSTIRRTIVKRELVRARPQLMKDGLLAEAEGTELWRITARLRVTSDLNYPEVIQRVDQQVNAVLRAESTETDKVRATYTGAFPMIHHAQQQLLDDLIHSFLLAVLLICPVMMILLRAVLSGLVAMCANIFPAVAIFGGMGWLGIPVDIGTILTASVALGIAVDDTIHFLTWYRRGLREGQTRNCAICVAFRRCSGAMVQTTMICGLAILVFVESSFVPASRFALLLFALLIAALVGDLVFLPAMLASPLGRLFGATNIERPMDSH